MPRFTIRLDDEGSPGSVSLPVNYLPSDLRAALAALSPTHDIVGIGERLPTRVGRFYHFDVEPVCKLQVQVA